MTSADKLVWDVPKGEWGVLRTGMMPTGRTNFPSGSDGTGLEIDKMSKEHLAMHFDTFIGQILTRIPAQDRRIFKVVVQNALLEPSDYVWGYCYTQLTDVEQEQNGLYYYDRTSKFDMKRIHVIFSKLPKKMK